MQVYAKYNILVYYTFVVFFEKKIETRRTLNKEQNFKHKHLIVCACLKFLRHIHLTYNRNRPENLSLN